jgi:CheY-like chemotaxis protein
MHRPQRILVVDDDVTSLMILHDALSKHRAYWEVETAPNGTEALQRFARDRFDLVVTDLKMPHMDGCQLTEAIRILDKTVPVLWITAFPEPNSEAKARRLGVCRCLHKPVSVAEIRRVVTEILGNCAPGPGSP